MNCPCNLVPPHGTHDATCEFYRSSANEGALIRFNELTKGKLPDDATLITISRPEWEAFLEVQREFLLQELTAKDTALRSLIEGKWEYCNCGGNTHLSEGRCPDRGATRINTVLKDLLLKLEDK